MGRFTLSDGSYFEGRYEHGSRVEGTAVSADGNTTYTGSFRGLKRHGQGVLVIAGRLRYRGEFREDQQTGEGECQYADGSAYSGQWLDGAWHGRGEWRERGGGGGTSGEGKGGKGGGDGEGAWYRGEFVNGLRHGVGTARDAQGNTYTGDWRRNVRHGRGTCAYACGDKYTGEWADGARHGEGACAYANGDKYQGKWERDQRHGYGAAVFADGVRFRGRWEEDCWVQSTADPTACRVAGPGLSRAVAGEVARLVIEARDDLGNRRLSGGECFRLEVRVPTAAALEGLGLVPAPAPAQGPPAGPDAKPGRAAHSGPEAPAAAEERMGALVAMGEVYDRDDGTYDVSYTCTAAGILELHVLLLEAGEGAEPDDAVRRHVADSPYIVRVAGGAPTPRTSTVAGAGGHRLAVAGRPASFVVEPRDVYGNRVDRKRLPRGLPLQVEMGNGVGEVPLAVEMPDSGHAEYRVSYTAPAVPGLYRLQVVDASTGRHVGGSPFSVRVDPAPPEGVAMAGGGSDGGSGAWQAGAGAAVASPAGAVVDWVAEWARRADAALRDADADADVDFAGEKGVPLAGPPDAYSGAPAAPSARSMPPGAAGGQAASTVATAASNRTALSSAAAAAVALHQAAATAGREVEQPQPQQPAAAAAAAEAVSEAASAAGISESEREYIMEHADVPCVEDLRDLWKIHQLQEERKARELLARLQQQAPRRPQQE
ncbi:hypothetical protein GPECTOR_71g567 [Gonium pectorale]|uniref:Uncharacterized protein n=1 Tax=Gonium pectorale TaxID=33097 RepID=A0A150G2V5_GONPE|nr:hypothetical protein GPECTOR_71g567 [Gonium pectorale]|eukprot:KXZ44206.1 hypothetical protein GPECTOR_71g567 [Gonium pectorale]